MPGQQAPVHSSPDTIRILVATDSHVGYCERDPIRTNDSWKTFHEVLMLAKDKDVDMVLLAGDLFHDNKPSRQAMYQVMRSLRMCCLGDKPCEIECVGDMSECFDGAFNHVNYEDPDINVAIPVFSIHGNHDDPSGQGHMAALDLLSIAGLVNYYGKTPESDNIQVKPVLLQKGQTKLALYGLSNVRDERLFRTFRDGKVKFFQPGTQKGDWFNLLSVHQNHHAYTSTGFLPENFLPEFMDLVIWGHEHECLIQPRYNPEMNFHVIQPGSSIATSLMPGEAVPKHVAILSVTGRDFKVEPIRLKTVRPFVMKEIVLSEDKVAKKLAKKENNRPDLTRHLISIVDDLIAQAKAEWQEAQDGTVSDEESEAPLPLVRLRVEFSAPDGGNFDCENPQRFSNRFVGKVANVNDVVQFYRKKAGTARKAQSEAEIPEVSVAEQISLDSVKVEKLVREFLAAQSLTILPQNSFGDAVTQFVDKDDKHAVELFVEDSLENQIKYLLNLDTHDEDDDIANAMDHYKSKLEELFAAGHLKKKRKYKVKPKPDNWDTDIDGEWEDNPGALERSDLEDEAEEDEEATPAPKGRGKAAPKTTAAAKKAAPATKKAAPAKPSRGKKKVVEESDEDEDIVMADNNDNDDEDEEEEESLFVKPAPPKHAGRKPAAAAAKPATAAAPKRAPARAKATTQSKLDFSQSQARAAPKKRVMADEVSDDDDDDEEDEDAFEPAPAATRSRARR